MWFLVTTLYLNRFLVVSLNISGNLIYILMSGLLGVLAESTVGFSGADILIVCKDASMQPMRRVLQSLDGQPLDAQAIASKRVRGELLLPMVKSIFLFYMF